MIDIDASLASLANNEHVHERGGPWKIAEDLDRYEWIIERTKPNLIIETGTRNGESARWFNAVARCSVVTIDVTPVGPIGPGITTITGDSTDPRVIARVDKIARGRRVMVSLDSDHCTDHVEREIAAYAPFVSVGCYLVVEDGIFYYADQALRVQHSLGEMLGDPLRAIIASGLPESPRWRRDVAVERMWRITHNPAGWWRRV
jgi:cephalosporin hydroxylase